jgi:hypothetical protein
MMTMTLGLSAADVVELARIEKAISKQGAITPALFVVNCAPFALIRVEKEERTRMAANGNLCHSASPAFLHPASSTALYPPSHRSAIYHDP